MKADPAERTVNPSISVIMLTYNRETLMPRAVGSVLAQTFKNFEFIIIDNGSTDKSGAIADMFAESDDRIKVIHRSRGSIGGGRNTGLDAAAGDYIAFIDDDDWCEPDFLGFLLSLALENAADVSICGAADKAFDEKLLMSPEEALIELMWRKRYNMAFPTKLFTKNLAAQIRFPEGDKYDDISQMHRLLALAKRVAYHGLPKYTFYRHEDNNSAWTTDHSKLDPATLDEYLRAYRERTVWLSCLFPGKEAAWKYFEWSFMISMVEKITRLGLGDCIPQRGSMEKELFSNREEFLRNDFTLDFEREWMRKYIMERNNG